MVASAVERRSAASLLKPLGAILTVVAVAAAAAWILGDPGRQTAMAEMLHSPFGLVGLFALSALSSATLLLPVPGIALTVLAATAADPLLVGIIAGIGQTVGELTGYLAGWSGGSLAGSRLTSSAIARWMRRRGWLTLFVLGLVPNPVFDVAGVLAGALKLPVTTFVLAAGGGKVLRNVVVAWAATLGLQLF